MPRRPGEQYLAIRTQSVPSEGTFISTTKLLDVIDKGTAALVVTGTSVSDKFTGQEIWYAESTVFLRGSGGFNGPKTHRQTPGMLAMSAGPTLPLPPARLANPDYVREEQTSPELAALYRLSGDYNPLHVDPEFAAMGGFKKPILHGLATMGIACRIVAGVVGKYKSVKVRFVGTVVPGERLRVEIWREAGRWVIFQVRVVESGKVVLGGGVMELTGDEGEVGEMRAKL